MSDMETSELRALKHRRKSAATMLSNAKHLLAQIGNFGAVVDSMEISAALGFAHTTKQYLERVVGQYDQKVGELEDRLGVKRSVQMIPIVVETGKDAEIGS
jgi:hypothetical protein